MSEDRVCGFELPICSVAPLAIVTGPDKPAISPPKTSVPFFTAVVPL